MLALAWEDVELERGVVSVRRTLTRRRDHGWKIGEVAKTSSSRRSIVIGQATIAALRSLRRRQAERRLRCGSLWVDHGLVFDRGNGHWLAPTTVRDAFQRAVAEAKMPELTPHGMRHTMATVLWCRRAPQGGSGAPRTQLDSDDARSLLPRLNDDAGRRGGDPRRADRGRGAAKSRPRR